MTHSPHLQTAMSQGQEETEVMIQYDTGDSSRNSAKAMAPSNPSESNALLKTVSLVLLTLQNAALILVMRYVRIRQGDMFMATTAVIVSEALKCLTALGIVFWEEKFSVKNWMKHLYNNIFSQPMDCINVSVPSLIYVLQNNLLYVAVSNLDAATFQVTYQLKILTTALFSVVMLKKQLSRLQWVSLVVLFIGVAIVQMQPDNTPAKAASTATTEVVQNPTLGLVAVIISCLMSGFAGVYFEKILKGTKQSVWVRNVQLGSLGGVIGLIAMYLKDGEKVAEKGFFFGYDYVVFIVIFIQAFGGLLVAVVVKYADNILKGFATSAAIIISCILSMYFFDFHVSFQFTCGASLVMASIYMYSKFVPVLSTKPTNA
ncbi:UDP-galactose translocator-like [Mizuhopecten yessoensis]|uniref:UDP-galactose translocator n=1 Tax=Mizuhopecten yessoensis TaxID=6573 RepID=A0A210PPQ3_MIZYE|nr:UDP-galactose translocator-like [Mizuhopecten yessoensis]OWF38458.1 UDP-galactose translocator [Mizuhopecten yessoensis]